MKMFTRNLPLKILSVVISLGLWFFVAYEVDQDVSKEVATPLEFRGLDDNLTVINPKNLSVEVDYVAKARLQSRMTSKDVQAWVDVSFLKSGDKEARLPIQASVPGGRVISINPQSAGVRVDRLQTREEPVEVVLTGNPGKGKLIGQSTVSPSKLVVQGPASLMPRLGGVRVELEASRFVHSPTATAEPGLLGIKPELRSYFVTQPELVEVHVEVLDKSAVRTLPVLPRLTGLPAPGWQVKNVQVDPQQVTVSGSELAVEGLHFIETAPLSLAGARKELSASLSLNLSKALKSEAHAVQVNVQIEPNHPYRRFSLSITPPNGTADPSSVLIEVFAPKGVLESLKARDFTIGLQPAGKGLFRVQVQAPEDQPILFAHPLTEFVRVQENRHE